MWPLINPRVAERLEQSPQRLVLSGSGQLPLSLFAVDCDALHLRLCLRDLRCHRQWETDPPGTLNLTHRIRWFLREGGADAEGGGADGIGGFEEARG